MIAARGSGHPMCGAAAGTVKFSEGLMHALQLRSLTLAAFGAAAQSRLPAAQACCVLRAVGQLTQLRSLTLTRTCGAAAAAAAAFSTLPGLESLQLYGWEMTGHDMRVTGAAIAALPALTQLHISGNALQEEGAEALAAAVGGLGGKLQNLDVGGSQLGDSGAAALARALRRTTALTWLDVSRNGLGDAGVRAIAAGLCGREVPATAQGRDRSPVAEPTAVSDAGAAGSRGAVGAGAGADIAAWQSGGSGLQRAAGGGGRELQGQAVVDMDEAGERPARRAKVARVQGMEDVGTARAAEHAVEPSAAGAPALRALEMSGNECSAAGVEAVAAAALELHALEEVWIWGVQPPFDAVAVRAALCAARPQLRFHAYALADRAPDGVLSRQDSVNDDTLL